MLRIVVNIAKKLPISGVEFSSVQASCSIEGEVANGQDAATEAAKLYYQAERAVDSQLRISTEQVKERQASQIRNGSGSSSEMVRTNNRSTNSPNASRPYSDNRRGPAPVTDGQLRYLDRLIQDTGTDINAILHHHQAGSLRDLSCQVAARLIDELKSGRTQGRQG